ncbi:MAG: hypothetical protein Kow00117_17660 [Phototrophicales bacterium]
MIKHRNILSLIILSLIALVLAVLLATQETSDPPQSLILPTNTPAPESILVFPELDADFIQAVRLEDPNSGKTLTIARSSEGDWQFLDRDDAPNQEIANQIALTLENMPYYASFLPEGDLTQYGFLPTGSLMFIQFVLFNGTQHFIIVGDPVSEEADTAPGQTNTFYAIIDERPEVYLVSRPAIAFLIVQLQNS